MESTLSVEALLLNLRPHRIGIPSSHRRHLLVSEFEPWTVDPETLAARRFGDPDPQRRLVYAEAVEIALGAGTLPVTG